MLCTIAMTSKLSTDDGSQALTYKVAKRVPREEDALWYGDSPVIIWKSSLWTIVSSVFGKYHTPCTINTTFVDFEKV